MHYKCIYKYANTGDSTGGHLSAALAIRWRDQVVLLNKTERKLGTDDSTENVREAALPRIRLQILIYPVLQIATASTPSMLINGNFLPSGEFFTRLIAIFAFPERVQWEPRFYKQLLAGRHLTRANRTRIAHYFEFVQSIESIDGVSTSKTILKFSMLYLRINK